MALLALLGSCDYLLRSSNTTLSVSDVMVSFCRKGLPVWLFFFINVVVASDVKRCVFACYSLLPSLTIVPSHCHIYCLVVSSDA